MSTALCERCGTTPKGARRLKYCDACAAAADRESRSVAARRAHERRRVGRYLDRRGRACVECSSEIPATYSRNRLTCSDACSRTRERRQEHERAARRRAAALTRKTCVICGARFSTTRSRQITCSKPCSAENNNASRRAQAQQGTPARQAPARTPVRWHPGRTVEQAYHSMRRTNPELAAAYRAVLNARRRRTGRPEIPA